MNRRSFLASLLATAALDPEKLLWVPGKKTIFIPSARLFYHGDIVGIVGDAPFTDGGSRWFMVTEDHYANSASPLRVYSHDYRENGYIADVDKVRNLADPACWKKHVTLHTSAPIVYLRPSGLPDDEEWLKR